LAWIAKDYLAVLATLAPSEYVFSQGTDIVSKKRNKLIGESIRMLICKKDWGLVTDEDTVWFLIRLIAIDQLSEPIDQSSIAISNRDRSSDAGCEQAKLNKLVAI
jgi:hypothetical protein